MRKWRAEHPDKARSISLIQNRKRQGMLNPTDETKSGPCEICGNVYETLHLDHDHATGLKRGWLCHWCNRKLGWFENRQETILSYLQRPKKLD
jgi:hypothetical protein